MDEHTSHEQAYKNGYDKGYADGKRDAVKKGEWEKYQDDKFMGYGLDGRIRYRKVYSYKCSKCWNYMAVKHKYCPHCGSDMRGEEDA